jgi:hypothetical protein
MVAVITFKGNNKMGVGTQRLIIVINNVKTIHVNSFAFIVENNELRFTDVDHHLVGPEPMCDFF